MQHTQNYQLPQWEKSDRIMMEDFNGAMSNIDTAIAGVKSEADAGIKEANSKADAAMTRSLFVFGTYSGTGTDLTITLGFRPKAILITERCEKGDPVYTLQALLFLDGHDYGVITFLDDGVKLTGQSLSAYREPSVNYSPYNYAYVAFR